MAGENGGTWWRGLFREAGGAKKSPAEVCFDWAGLYFWEWQRKSRSALPELSHMVDRSREAPIGNILRKEVIQPQVPLRLPCYDLVPIAEFIFGACFPLRG